MEKTKSNIATKLLTRLFFAITVALIVLEFCQCREWLLIVKPLLIPTLLILYIVVSKKRSWIYFIALTFTFASNVLFLFTEKTYLLLGLICVMLYMIFNIIVALKMLQKVLLLPFIIATLPFLFIFSCLLNLTMTADSPGIYPAIFNGLLFASLAGISLSSYVMNDNKANSWLAISTLLFVVLAFLFTIQKYYLANIAFQPMSVIVFSVGQYAFYRFVVEAEKSVSNND